MRSVRLRAIACALSVTSACGGSRELMPPPARTTTDLTIHVVALDDRPLPAITIRAANTALTTDAVPLGADGRARVTLPLADSVELTVTPAGAEYYGSAWRERFARDTTIDVVLVPRTWTIQRGTYAGERVSLDLVRAAASDIPNTHFINAFAPAARLIAAWPWRSLPIAVAFDTVGGGPRWTAVDSAFFWEAVADMHATVGRELFRPTSDLPATRTGTIGFRFDLEKQGPRGILTTACEAGRHLCDRLAGQVWLGRGFSFPGVFSDENRHLIRHELMHALGFGHACYWPSVVVLTRLECVPLQAVPLGLTSYDVAYIEASMSLASRLETYPAAWAIDEALHATNAGLAGNTVIPASHSYVRP